HRASARLARAPARQPAARQRSAGGAADDHVGAGKGSNTRLGTGPWTEARVTRVHQVLATLGYGDAIGHEVLGIQRVLRAAGYESDIFVETADHRLESQTRDYR